jgi:hypothetical protein
VEGSTKTFGYVSNGSRSDDDRQSVDFRRIAAVLWRSLLGRGGLRVLSPHFAVITDLRDGSYLDYLHPDDRAAVVAEHIKSPNKGPNDIIYRLRGNDGIYRCFHTRAEPYFNEDGSISTGRSSFRLICPSSDFAVPTRPPIAFARAV